MSDGEGWDGLSRGDREREGSPFEREDEIEGRPKQQGKPKSTDDDLFGEDGEDGFFDGFEFPRDALPAIQRKRSRPSTSTSDYDAPRKTPREEETEKVEFTNELEAVEYRMRMGKKRKTTVDPDYFRKMGADTLIDMNQAWLDDDNAIDQGKPAYKKLELLPRLEKVFVIKEFTNHLRKHDFLTTCMKWLIPLRQGQLPNLAIRTFILKVLTQFDLDEDNLSDLLKESNIGNAVMYLFKHPQETHDNKRVAKQLIYKWSRSVLNLAAEYQTTTTLQRVEPTKVAPPPQDSSQTSEFVNSLFSPGNDPKDADMHIRARIPAPTIFDYKFRPKSAVEESTQKGAAKKTDTTLTRLKAASKKTDRPVFLSVEGRGLN